MVLAANVAGLDPEELISFWADDQMAEPASQSVA
jgi:hypothetical protein